MRDRVKTLVLYANGTAHPRLVAEDTVFRGMLGLSEADHSLSRPLWRRALARRLWQRFESLSYMQDWQDAFCSAPELDIETCNIINLVELVQARRKINTYPLVVILHSAAGDDLSQLRRLERWFQGRRGKLLVLLGNEYDLMPDKIGFLREVGADYIGSQLPLDAACWLYAECDRSQVLPAPHALNPQQYRPSATSSRTIDIGFVGNVYPYFIGDLERTCIVEYFRRRGPSLGLTCNIETRRLSRAEWAKFLQDCKATIGAEAGTYYLERTDETKRQVQNYLKVHPEASFEEVFERFFRYHPRPVSGKAISSRHFEPAGTLTCQILLEGRYNDILVGDDHYIELKRDFSNIENVLERFNDGPYRTAMAQRTREYMLGQHTYQHRVSSLINSISTN